MLKILENAKRLDTLKRNQVLPIYKRYLFKDLIKSPSKITGIYGSRGVGKTTILLQILEEIEIEDNQKIYVSWDHPIFQDISLFDFIDEFSKRGGKLIIIDEIHEAKDFQEQLKSVYDFLDVKVFFSGSSAIEITNSDFARRYSMYNLAIFSLREYLELSLGISLKSYTLDELFSDHENIVPKILKKIKDRKILKYYYEFINVGAYPFYFEDKLKYTDRINETINTIIHIDLGKIFNIQQDKIYTLKKLLLTICVSKPLEVSIEKLASKVGITKATLYKYIQYLSKAELIRYISHEAKRFKSIRKPDKLYLSNTNLFDALCQSSDIGTKRETYFASMISYNHSLNYISSGDFLVDEKFTIEIGGKNKDFQQIKDIPNSFIVADDIEIGFGKKIPLWLFGFLR